MPTSDPDSVAAIPPLPTAEEIAGLFLAHDVLPNRGVYLKLPEHSRVGRCEACAVGVLLVASLGDARTVRDRMTNREDAWDMLRRATGWPRDFIRGVDHGFTAQDGAEDHAGFLGLSAGHGTYDGGFAVGWRAAEIVHASDVLPGD